MTKHKKIRKLLFLLLVICLQELFATAYIEKKHNDAKLKLYLSLPRYKYKIGEFIKCFITIKNIDREIVQFYHPPHYQSYEIEFNNDFATAYMVEVRNFSTTKRVEYNDQEILYKYDDKNWIFLFPQQEIKLEDNHLFLTKKGTFEVRAKLRNRSVVFYSDWIKVVIE